MKITPTLPGSHQPSLVADKKGVVAVRAPSRSRDAADEPYRQAQQVHQVGPAERERLAARVESLRSSGYRESARVSRALASYAEVADEGERSGLHDLLGFDAYA